MAKFGNCNSRLTVTRFTAAHAHPFRARIPSLVSDAIGEAAIKGCLKRVIAHENDWRNYGGTCRYSKKFEVRLASSTSANLPVVDVVPGVLMNRFGSNISSRSDKVSRQRFLDGKVGRLHIAAHIFFVIGTEGCTRGQNK